MKFIKIKKDFFDYIKHGIKDFEIRKKSNLEGIVELVVICDHQVENYEWIKCKSEFKPNEIIPKKSVVDRLKVKLKLNKKIIGLLIIEQMITFKMLIIKNNDWVSKAKRNCLTSIREFLKEYGKDAKKLYWYDLQVIQ